MQRKNQPRIGIVGAGIMGRLLAWQLVCRDDCSVTLFDQDKLNHGRHKGMAAAYTAAGMLSPISEADSAEEEIVTMGQRSLELWPELLSSMGGRTGFYQRGSIILAHPGDQADLDNFRQRVSRVPAANGRLRHLAAEDISKLEPEINQKFNQGVFIEGECWLSSSAVMRILAERIEASPCLVQEHTHITRVEPGLVGTDCQTWEFDRVIDCRGLGAKPDVPGLRGVRGETIALHAPEVNIRHLVRLMHPRYRIYIVPRAKDIYIIGATQIESNSQESITVRSTLELLSAAYSVHSGFAEATVMNSRVNCRPALPDNLPMIESKPGLMRINGLFRHGFLLAPALAEQAIIELFESENSGAENDSSLVQEINA